MSLLFLFHNLFDKIQQLHAKIPIGEKSINH